MFFVYFLHIYLFTSKDRESGRAIPPFQHQILKWFIFLKKPKKRFVFFKFSSYLKAIINTLYVQRTVVVTPGEDSKISPMLPRCPGNRNYWRRDARIPEPTLPLFCISMLIYAYLRGVCAVTHCCCPRAVYLTCRRAGWCRSVSYLCVCVLVPCVLRQCLCLEIARWFI